MAAFKRFFVSVSYTHLTPAAAVADLAADADAAAIVTAVNELLANLRTAGFLAE